MAKTTGRLVSELNNAHDALGSLLDDHYREWYGSQRVKLEDALNVIREKEDELRG